MKIKGVILDQQINKTLTEQLHMKSQVKINSSYLTYKTSTQKHKETGIRVSKHSIKKKHCMEIAQISRIIALTSNLHNKRSSDSVNLNH